MVKALRLMKIKELLKANGIIDTQTLSDLSDVSKVTIRSDLMQLEKEGFLIRTHGGAILREPASTPAAVEQSKIAFAKQLGDTQEQLQSLGPVVREHIQPGTWILLGYGKTCREIAKAIVDLDIKIVTGNVDAAIVLSENQNMDIFVPGGYLSNRYGYMTLGGEWCQKALTNLRVDQAYLSIAGLDASGFYVGDVMECQTLQLFRQIANEVIVTVDSSKFGKSAFFHIGGLNYADTIITDEGIPENYRHMIRDANVKLLTPASIFEK